MCGAILLSNKPTQQLYQVSTPCIDDHHFKEEETKSVGELSNTCSQIVLKCSYLARIGRPDILWSVNKLARFITKWTKACDKRLNRLISYIHHTCEYKQYCYVGNTAKQCRLGLFQDSDFAGDLEDSKSTSGGTLCIFGSHTFVPMSWMCKKQTAVSHSLTESEIISLTNVLNNIDASRSFVVCVRRQRSSDQDDYKWKKSHNETCFRTHRVGLDRLFDRINLDPKIEIKHIDTKNQLADMLTKGNFTRDEWNHLLCLFNIGHFSSTVCSEVMSKRTQKESGEERVTAKSRPMMSLIAREPSNLSSSASESPGKRSYESQSPLSAKAEKYDRTGQPVVGSDPRTAPGYHHKQFVESSYSARFSGWDDGKAWSSQEWKADELMDDRTGTPVVYPQRGAWPQQFVIGDDEAELEIVVRIQIILG